ncbi:hypothetical protein Tco_0838713 [Tanacetum coccineum]|uniref:Uncharacterized protein n=1 Tax=Tanacetum coccineum TaxID=301880 RepID=A0ABQ5ANK8_9ASTR
MADLDLCSKHNMVAYLEKHDGNTEFNQIMDFLAHSLIHFALTVSLIVSTSFVEQFWTSAKSRTVNNISYIDAIVAGKPVTISEASIRSDLRFDDADGIDTLNNQVIFDTIQLMGYDGDLNTLTFSKALFSPQWKFLFHTMNHCINSKSTSWDQIPTNIATAVICLATNQKYNFSKLIFDGMMRHLDASKKFVMYPRFLQIFLRNQLRDVPVPMDHFPVPALTKKKMRVKFQNDHLNPNQYPLLLTQVKTNLSHSLTHLPDLLLLSLFLIPIQRVLVGIMEVTAQAAEIKDLKAQIKQLKKKARPVINHHKAWFRDTRLKKQQKKKDIEKSNKRRSVTPPNWVAAEYGSGACYFSDQ